MLEKCRKKSPKAHENFKKVSSPNRIRLEICLDFLVHHRKCNPQPRWNIPSQVWVCRLHTWKKEASHWWKIIIPSAKHTQLHPVAPSNLPEAILWHVTFYVKTKCLLSCFFSMLFYFLQSEFTKTTWTALFSPQTSCHNAIGHPAEVTAASGQNPSAPMDTGHTFWDPPTMAAR